MNAFARLSGFSSFHLLGDAIAVSETLKGHPPQALDKVKAVSLDTVLTSPVLKLKLIKVAKGMCLALSSVKHPVVGLLRLVVRPCMIERICLGSVSLSAAPIVGWIVF